MAKYKVLYTDTSFPDINIEAEALARADAEIILADGTDEDSLIRCGQGCVGIMVDYAPITRRVIEGIPTLKVVSRLGIGVNNVDIDAASEKGVMVVNCPDYCRDEVADHTLALFLACVRQICYFNDRTKNRIWDIVVEREIFRMRGQKFAIYGLGGIAQKVVERLKPLGLEIYAYDPYLPESVFNELGVHRTASLEELCDGADALSLHAPLTPETRGCINMSLFRRMHANAILVNTSRGPLVNEEDLADALEQKVIAAAGLDVMVEEPPAQGSRLLAMKHVIITPHVAFSSVEADQELRRRSAEEVANVILTGKPQLKAFFNRKAFGA